MAKTQNHKKAIQAVSQTILIKELLEKRFQITMVNVVKKKMDNMKEVTRDLDSTKIIENSEANMYNKKSMMMNCRLDTADNTHSKLKFRSI